MILHKLVELAKYYSHLEQHNKVLVERVNELTEALSNLLVHQDSSDVQDSYQRVRVVQDARSVLVRDWRARLENHLSEV